MPFHARWAASCSWATRSSATRRGALSLIPERKLDDPSKLKRSLHKLLDYDFDVLLLCDGQPVLRDGKLKVVEFLNTLV